MVLARLACILLIGALAQVNVRPVSPSWHQTTDRAFNLWTFQYSMFHEPRPLSRIRFATSLVPLDMSLSSVLHRC